MMGSQRKRHNTEFKAKVAIAAIRQDKTTNELTAEYGVHATQIHNWKKQALAMIPQAFSRQTSHVQQDRAAEIDELHRQLGQVIAERDWLKKKSNNLS
jgi:transposase